MHPPNKMPQIREFMTRAPISVAHDTPLDDVEAILREHRIRHVPVAEGVRLVGLLSEANVRAALMSGITSYLARDAMIPDPYVTAASTGLDEVSAQMAEDKYGSVIVQDDEGRVVGIFTTVDACRALRQVLQERYG